MKQIVHATCIKHTYPDSTQVNLCGLEFEVNANERVAILGPSGAGKTTLLKHILGVLRPAEGEIKVFGVDPEKDLEDIRERVGFVMQHVDRQLIQPTVYDEIAFSPRNYGYSESEVKKMVKEVLKELDIENLQDKIPHYLSGGQKKKVALAASLVLKPELLILDEPFQGLDPKSRSEYIELLNHLTKKHGMAIISTLHEVELVPLIADSVYLLNKGGAISKRGTPEEIFSDEKELEEYNLEVPVLFKLFKELKKKHKSITMPTTVDEALKQIKKL